MRKHMYGVRNIAPGGILLRDVSRPILDKDIKEKIVSVFMEGGLASNGRKCSVSRAYS
jgi:hypothetical protein